MPRAIPPAFCAVLGAYLAVQLPHADPTVAAVNDMAGTWALPVMAVSLIGSDVANACTGMLAFVPVVSCSADECLAGDPSAARAVNSARPAA